MDEIEKIKRKKKANEILKKEEDDKKERREKRDKKKKDEKSEEKVKILLAFRRLKIPVRILKFPSSGRRRVQL